MLQPKFYEIVVCSSSTWFSLELYWNFPENESFLLMGCENSSESFDICYANAQGGRSSYTQWVELGLLTSLLY